MATSYSINKGVNRPIEFHGIRAQYINYLALGLVALLLLFAILYLAGISLYLILPVVGMAGTVLYSFVSRYSRKYGVYGVLRQTAFRRLPKAIKTRSVTTLLKQNDHVSSAFYYDGNPRCVRTAGVKNIPG